MKIKTVLVVLLVSFGFIGILIWGYPLKGKVAPLPGTISATATSSLVTTAAFYDFGTISMKDGNVTKEFTFTNPIDKDVTINSIQTSCMCTTAFLVGADGSIKGPFGMPGHGGPARSIEEVIKPGESRTLRVVFDPNAHGPAGVGSIDRFVYVTDTSGATLSFEIKATVTP